jgi:hypothetical protein
MPVEIVSDLDANNKSDSDILDPVIHSSDNMFWALHSTAINPNTQVVAKYDELNKCSDSNLWIQANTEEFR